MTIERVRKVERSRERETCKELRFDEKKLSLSTSLSLCPPFFSPNREKKKKKMSPPPPAPLAAASSPAPAPDAPPLFPRNENTSLSGAAFLRRAASAGLVSVSIKQPSAAAPSAAPRPLPRAPSASAVFSRASSSSFAADAPAPVSAFLPIEGLPAPSGLLRALSGEQGLPPQVELR